MGGEAGGAERREQEFGGSDTLGGLDLFQAGVDGLGVDGRVFFGFRVFGIQIVILSNIFICHLVYKAFE